MESAVPGVRLNPSPVAQGICDHSYLLSPALFATGLSHTACFQSCGENLRGTLVGPAQCGHMESTQEIQSMKQ